MNLIIHEVVRIYLKEREYNSKVQVGRNMV